VYRAKAKVVDTFFVGMVGGRYSKTYMKVGKQTVAINEDCRVEGEHRRERLSGRVLSAHQQACLPVMKCLACSWTPMQHQLSTPYLLPAGLAGGWRSVEAGGGPSGIDSSGGAFPTVLCQNSV
jgi:hypothetical protein